MRINILDVPVDNLLKQDVLAKISQALTLNQSLFITTPNPEMLVESERDWFFKQVFKKADLNIADGFGLVLASKYLYGKKLSRLPGVELMGEICKIAAVTNKSVYLVGSEEGIAELTAKALLKKYPGLKIAGAEKGIVLNSQESLKIQNSISDFQNLVGLNFDRNANQQLLERICLASPDILFVAFGYNKQEKWLAEFLPKFHSVKIGMGVGGAFDFLSGKIKRAPKLFCYLGFEWLWRLSQQPAYRLKRIWRAIITFSWLIFCNKKQIKLPYRQGVIGFVVNNEGNFFIGRRRSSKMDYYFFNLDHWQPPQGGINKNEKPEEAVIREVREETGMPTEIIYACQETYKYDWTIAFIRRKFHFRGQNKKIFLLKYEGEENDIKLDTKELIEYKWVNFEELKRLIHPMRRPSLEILLKEYGKIR